MEEKRAYCEPLSNARDLVKFINNAENGVLQENIVTVLDRGGQLLLIYYK